MRNPRFGWFVEILCASAPTIVRITTIPDNGFKFNKIFFGFEMFIFSFILIFTTLIEEMEEGSFATKRFKDGFRFLVYIGVLFGLTYFMHDACLHEELYETWIVFTAALIVLVFTTLTRKNNVWPLKDSRI